MFKEDLTGLLCIRTHFAINKFWFLFKMFHLKKKNVRRIFFIIFLLINIFLTIFNYYFFCQHFFFIIILTKTKTKL